LLDIILALTALGVLVTVHETGHFIAARLCGVKVEVFSIGFGKPLLKRVLNGIEYKLGWVPLGGYVKMKGDSLEEDAVEEADSFQFTRWWKKLIIAFSGPLANFLLALLIFILTFILPVKMEDQNPVIGQSGGDYALIFQPGDSIITVNNKPVTGWYQFIGSLSQDKANTIQMNRSGRIMTVTMAQIDPVKLTEVLQPAVSTLIGEVSPGMSAWRAGLLAGDQIIMVDSTQVKDWYQMRDHIINAPLESVHLTIKRGDSLFARTLKLEPNPMTEGQRLIGIMQTMPVTYIQTYTPGQALGYGVRATVNFVALNYVGLYKMFSHPETIKSSVGGPVMIYSLSSQSARKGWSSWLLFVAAISLVLMIMNLLPIPVLDGGHVMFALIQAVIGRPLPRKVQVILQNIGLMLLLLLMAYAFYNDFSKVFARAMSTMGKP
jgi:regulator of sigma E protease